MAYQRSSSLMHLIFILLLACLTCGSVIPKDVLEDKIRMEDGKAQAPSIVQDILRHALVDPLGVGLTPFHLTRIKKVNPRLPSGSLNKKSVKPPT